MRTRTLLPLRNGPIFESVCVTPVPVFFGPRLFSHESSWRSLPRGHQLQLRSRHQRQPGDRGVLQRKGGEAEPQQRQHMVSGGDGQGFYYRANMKKEPLGTL